jgi:hypothetical protein
MVTLGGLLVTATVLLPAAADAAANAESSAYDPATVQCRLTDPRVPEVSGAVETSTGWLVVNDKSEDVWALDQDCRVTRYWHSDRKAQGRPVDVEDLTTGPDGTLWLADTGGNRLVRPVVHLVGLTTDKTVVRVALRLPRTGLDIEAAVVTPGFELVLLTKTAGGVAEVLTAPLPTLPTTEPTPLRERGRLDLETVPDVPSGAGLAITGAALSPDGSHLALRTYTDVYELDTVGDTVVDALTTRTPRWVARVPQPQGEAISYGPPGSDRLSLLSEGLRSSVLVMGIHRTNTDATSFPGAPRWPLYAAGALVLVCVAAARGLRLVGRRLDGGLVVGALVLALGLAGTGLIASLRSPGYRSTAVLSLAPRNPVGIGADAVELLGPRYVALLDDPGLVSRAGQLVGRSDLATAAEVKAQLDPGTINLEIAVVSGNPDLSSRVANALAGLVQDIATTDPLVYGRRSASAQPAGARDLPSASQLAALGAALSAVAALVGGLVWVRRRPLGSPNQLTSGSGRWPARRSTT